MVKQTCLSNGLVLLLATTAFWTTDAFVVANHGIVSLSTRASTTPILFMGVYDFVNEPLGGKSGEDPLDEKWKNQQEILEARRQKNQQEAQQKNSLKYSATGSSQLQEGQPMEETLNQNSNQYHPGEQEPKAFPLRIPQEHMNNKIEDEEKN